MVDSSIFPFEWNDIYWHVLETTTGMIVLSECLHFTSSRKTDCVNEIVCVSWKNNSFWLTLDLHPVASVGFC